MEKPIRHDGIIEAIEGEHIRVRIIQFSACSECRIATHCKASESKEKIVDVYQHLSTPPSVGDAVVVSISSATAKKALLIGFVIPLVILLAVLSVMLGLGSDEGLSALCALAVFIPYYIIVWFCRDHISKNLELKIEDKLQ